MASRTAQRQVRQRKLSTKANLPIHREGEVDLLPVDDDASRNIPRIETGVEKAEEIEHHLQAIIQQPQQGSVGQLYIPTRETTESALEYDRFYHDAYREPHSYIRFSSTVEDCYNGSPYCMSDDDEDWLKTFNAKKQPKSQCSEDNFEHVMFFFEETARDKQPYATITGETQPLPLEEMETSPHIDDDEMLPPDARRFISHVYKHWELQRQKRLNQPLMPTLKFERNIEADESDPYVCFRRREHRQVRKTRGRDAQVTEKIKRLRLELEQARQLINHVKMREHIRANQLELDRRVFEQRSKVKETKRHLGIKGDDEDLINQKPVQKPKLPNGVRPPNAPFPPNHKALLNRSDSLALRASDAEYVQLDDLRANEAAKRKSAVEENKTKHRAWNTGWVDDSWRPITPPFDDSNDASDVERDPLGRELRGWARVNVTAAAVKAKATASTSLPTPPESTGIASPAAEDSEMALGEKSADRPSKHTRSHSSVVRFASPPPESIISTQPAREATVFRKRVGRNGRQYIDRRHLKRSHSQFAFEAQTIFDSHPSRPRHLQAQNGLRRKQLKQPVSSDDEASSPFGQALDALRQLREDRFRYDRDSDDEEDEDFSERAYLADPVSSNAMFYRTVWSRSAEENAARQAAQAPTPAQLQQIQMQRQQQQQAKVARMSSGGAGSAVPALNGQQMQPQRPTVNASG